jgi:predicted transcriptional regulator
VVNAVKNEKYLNGQEKKEMIKEVLKKGNRQGMKMKEVTEMLGQKQSVTSSMMLALIKDGTVVKSENTIDGVYLYSLVNYDGYAENIKPVDKPKPDKAVPKRLENTVKFISEKPKPDKIAVKHIADKICAPSHYTNGSIECIDAIKAMLSVDEYTGFLRGNILKYQWRYKHKNGVEDLRKAQWYTNKLIEYSIK